MLLNKIILALSLVLLFCLRLAVYAAAKKKDGRRVRAINIFRLGLSLSACSYVTHIARLPPTSALSLLSFFLSFAGTVFIWVGWMEHAHLLRERLRTPLPQRRNEEDGGQASGMIGPLDKDLPRLSPRTRTALQYAQAEGQRRRQSCIDTDHLLSGLLAEPCTGSDILDRLGVKQARIRQAMGQTERTGPTTAESLPLSERAHRVFALAAQEAYRFDEESVGTDHMLLGLVLAGTGAAAGALFQAGVTVGGVRDEIMKNRAVRKR